MNCRLMMGVLAMMGLSIGTHAAECPLKPLTGAVCGFENLARPAHVYGMRGFHPSVGGTDDTRFTCAVTDDAFVFRFEVVDATVCAAASHADKKAVNTCDRVELFFSATPEVKGAYYCAEIDPHGLVMDYCGHLYRKLDFSWSFKTMKIHPAPMSGGYVISGSVSRKELADLGIDLAAFGLGVFRADFDQGKLVSWCSAVPMPDPAKPDFHVPGMFFWFRGGGE